MPRSSARRRTSSQRALRLCGSSPVVGSSRNRIGRVCTSASARSRRRFMPPEYPPTRRSAASVSPMRSSSSLARAARRLCGAPADAPCSRRCSRPVRIESSAASWSAAPMAARTSRTLRGDVEGADRRAAAGRRQQRRQHLHRRRLAGAVGTEEAVDLARLHLEVDSRDSFDPALRIPARGQTPRFPSMSSSVDPSAMIEVVNDQSIK